MIPYCTEQLSRLIKSSFRIRLTEEHVENAFPHQEIPSVDEMEKAIDLQLNNKPLPIDLEAKLSRKPTKEMLDDFCKERGLIWFYNEINKVYQFELKSFKNE